MAKFAVILPAAGNSSRMTGFQKKKPFVDLKGRPVWVRTVEHFLSREDVCQTILVIAPDDMDWFRETFRPNLAFMDISLVAGGSCRAESVRNGLQAVKPEADYIAVHDAARPLLSSKWIDEIFAAAQTHKAAIPGLKISSTVKRVSSNGTITETVDRTGLVQAQTPQVFERSVLEKAFAICRRLADATDEASMVEAAGHPVHVIDGWPMNIKLTTNEDFKLAELYVNALPKSGGLGSLHPFGDELFR
ncbi:MAG: 2-C-methyl-D-erythritol 4-phosphate cytidylyltransferase [Planctomycetaceae bacterium]